MAKGKAQSPQELYKIRKQREEQEGLAFLPPGLYNHGNTCFMNSVLQGLIATRLLSQLVHFAPIPEQTQAHSATLLASRRSPQLTNGHGLAGEYEQKWVDTMPIGDMFLNVVHRAWDAQRHRRRDNLSPKPLLATLGKKYDQYLDFAQQDAHEFLRILLDAMRMEELDVIKKLQPPPKKRRRTTLPAAPPPPADTLISLADMIFGGKLASILVCQKCKHVSHTYEDFNDLSLSIKHEDYDVRGARKRDRLKTFAKRLGMGNVVSLGTPDMLQPPRASSVPPSPRDRPDGYGELVAVGSGSEEPRRRSLDVKPEESKPEEEGEPIVRINGVTLEDEKHIETTDGWAKIGRRLSLGLASKSSKERKGRSADRGSRDFSQSGRLAAGLADSGRSSLSDTTPEIRLSSPSGSIEHKRQSAPTPPPSLSPVRAVPPITIAAPQPQVAHNAHDILADVSSGDAMWLKLGGGLPGVEECMRMFTAVEVLDGENMVGCRRCWKIAHGEYVPRPPQPNGGADNHESPVLPMEPKHTHRPSLPTSISTPLISVYSLPTLQTTDSSASLPLATPASSASDSVLRLHNGSEYSDDTDIPTPPSSATSVHSLPLSSDPELDTPPAATSPATTVRIVPPTPSTTRFDAIESEASQPSLDSVSEVAELPPTARPVLNGVGYSTDSLHPPVTHHRLSDESTDCSSGDESDVSATSASAQLSSASASDDARTDNIGEAKPKPRAKKPKPVIMRPAYKRYLVSVPPPVLVIHLKRFQQVSKTMISFSNGFKKLDDYVTFPELFDLTPFLAPKKEDFGLSHKHKGGIRLKGKRAEDQCMYRLYAVVVHIGNMLGGHYISYVALPSADDIASIPPNPPAAATSSAPPSPPTTPMEVPPGKRERQWAYVSDTVVRLTTLEEVLKAKAYICMYERV
ncbi:hypothetical protein C8J57DRAFT_1346057 [Mycena rebaudengoi]|nr:hypothetical protein C8J57DRAFT_1346057 [Mycena rebaudengoi]